MELLFETKSAEYLREVIYDTISQEETAETIVPDSYPDVERILDTFASVVLRGKEVRNGSANVSGGIHAGAIYAPEDHSAPHVLHFYIPFTIKVENENLTEATQVHVDCKIRSVDARVVNSRKVLLRANLCGRIKGYEAAEQEEYTFLPEQESDLQLKQNTYQIVRAVEMVEKPFTIAEEAELPSGRAAMQELYKYQADAEVSEEKIIGNKGVFKGNINLKLLYLTEDEEIATWSCQLPFSQYAELEREYDEESFQTSIALTDINVEDANGQGKRLLVNLQLLAQGIVIGQESFDAIEDAYSIHHDFSLRWRDMESTGQLDRQSLSQNVRGAVAVPVKSIIDTQAYIDTPVAKREGTQMTIMAPIHASVLYLDETGEIQGISTRMEATCQTALAEGCTCRASANLSGEPFAVPSGEGLEIRCTANFDLDSISTERIRTLCGGELSDEPISAKGRPSIILRAVSPEEELWSIAKHSRTTTDAIRSANALSDDEELPNGMLLIPIM